MVVYNPTQNAFFTLLGMFLYYFIEYWFVSLPLIAIFIVYLMRDNKKLKRTKINIKVIKRR